MQTPLESFLGAVCQNPSVRFGTPAAQLSARWCRMSLPDLEGKNTSSPLKDFLRLVACVCSDHFRALNWLTQKWRIMRLCQLPFIYRTDIQRLKTKDKAVLCSWPGFLKPDVYLLCTTSATRQVHLSCLIQLSCRQVLQCFAKSFANLARTCRVSIPATSSFPIQRCQVGFSGFYGTSSCKFLSVSNASVNHWHCPTLNSLCCFMLSPQNLRNSF